MALGVGSVLLHPYPDIEPLKLQEPLAGLLLISPWVKFACDAESYKENHGLDILSHEVSDTLINNFVHPSDQNNWSEPIQADASWWKNLLVSNVLIVYGGYEVFRDDNRKIGETLKLAGLSVESVECPLQVHIDCILDAQFDMEPGLMSTTTWRWLQQVFA